MPFGLTPAQLADLQATALPSQINPLALFQPPADPYNGPSFIAPKPDLGRASRSTGQKTLNQIQNVQNLQEALLGILGGLPGSGLGRQLGTPTVPKLPYNEAIRPRASGGYGAEVPANIEKLVVGVPYNNRMASREDALAALRAVRATRVRNVEVGAPNPLNAFKPYLADILAQGYKANPEGGLQQHLPALLAVAQMYPRTARLLNSVESLESVPHPSGTMAGMGNFRLYLPTKTNTATNPQIVMHELIHALQRRSTTKAAQREIKQLGLFPTDFGAIHERNQFRIMPTEEIAPFARELAMSYATIPNPDGRLFHKTVPKEMFYDKTAQMFPSGFTPTPTNKGQLVPFAVNATIPMPDYARAARENTAADIHAAWMTAAMRNAGLWR